MKKFLGLLVLASLTTSAAPAQKYRKGIAAGGTHFPVLATMVINTSGPVLEMGCGDYSTPLLHALCAPQKRLLVSTDVDKQWISHFLDLECDWHKFIHVHAYETKDPRNDWYYCADHDAWKVVGGDTHWSVVLIDHTPGMQRVLDIVRLRNNTDIFVVHDSEDPRYGYEPVLNTFKYKYVYDRYNITTTVVSDVIDVAHYFK